MSKYEKLLKRFLSRPKDFSFKELESLLKKMGYEEFKTGKTLGSRVMFINRQFSHTIRLYKPHNDNILKIYQIIQIEKELKSIGVIK